MNDLFAAPERLINIEKADRKSQLLLVLLKQPTSKIGKLTIMKNAPRQVIGTAERKLRRMKRSDRLSNQAGGRINTCIRVCTLLLLAGCATAGTSSTTDGQNQSLASIQPGDGSLTCDELARAVSQMDQLFNSEQPSEPSIGRSVATSVGSFVLGQVPLLGPVIGAAVSTEQAKHDAEEANDRTNLKSMIHDRKEHLVALYDRKNCDQGTVSAKLSEVRGNDKSEQ
jgi:hypothetical protein